MATDKSVPGWEDGHRTRFRQVLDTIGGLAPAAAIASVTPEQVARWRDGRARPPFLAMAQLAAAAGVSLDWLATGASVGSQPPTSADAKQPAEPIDPQLLGTIVDAVRALYKGEGAAIPDRSLGEEAARIYGELSAVKHDVSATLIALGEILAERRRRLRESATNPSRSKRPA